MAEVAAPVPAAARDSVLDRLKACYHWTSRELLGRGSYGKVFLTFERITGGPRAIKVVSVDRNPEWQRETQCEQWRHPNIVRMFDVLMPDPSNAKDVHCAFVMPAADMDLHSFIMRRRFPGVPPDQARTISLQCTTGLSFLHEQGVLHRDLKPGNVLLFFGAALGAAPSHDAGAGYLSLQACLADFGFARLHTHAAMTAEVQTPGYRAPEILLAQEGIDEGSYTAAIDVWSLGCIFYELVTGVRFAVAENSHSSVAQLVSALGPCPDVSPWRSHPCFDLFQKKSSDESRLLFQRVGEQWQVISKCLCWLPEGRATCAAMLEMPWFVLATTQESAREPAQSHRQAALAGSSQARTKVDTAASPSLTLSLASARICTAADQKSSELVCCACAGHCYTPGHRNSSPPCGHMVLRQGVKTFCSQCSCLSGVCV